MLPEQRALRADGVVVDIGARALDLLIALVQRAGTLVSKHDLLDLVWPDAAVEEANLHVQVFALRKLLGREAIATVPGRGYQFVLLLGPGPGPASPPADTALPPSAAALAPLLGRDDDLARVAQSLAHPTRGGFVTVTGAGGSGKTLLSRHLAARFGTLGDVAPVWVDLIELTAPDTVVPAVAVAAGVYGPPRSAAALAQALADARLWLVLDNAEHLLDAVGDLVDALRREAPGVTLLVTSQAPLRRTGEVVHMLAGLSVPSSPCTAAEALPHAAVALFVAHAKQADRRFRFGDAQVDDVVAVCSSLAGSALGVQLAAALLGQMPLAAMRERLARCDRVTDAAAVDASANVLRSALSWSHDLLSPAAQRVFRRLAVVQGPLALPLVLAMTAEDGRDGAAGPGTEAADDARAEAVADLVDRSLVQCETGVDGMLRYSLLEAPRALALELLHKAGERVTTLLRLAQAMAPLSDALHALDWSGHPKPEPQAALMRQLPSAADVVAAFEASLADRSADAAATTVRLNDAMLRGAARVRSADVRLRWAAALRVCAETAGLAPELRGRALDGTAGLTRHSDLTARRVDLERAAVAWREAGDVLGEFRALARAAQTAALIGQHADAAALLARVRALEDPAWPPGRRRWRWYAEGTVAITADDLPRAIDAWRHQLALVEGWDAERVQALHSLAMAERITGDARAALPRLVEAVAVARRIHMHATLYGFLLPSLVATQLALGDVPAARAAAVEGWPQARALDAVPWWADHLALLAAQEARPRTAARLLGLADVDYGRLNIGRQALVQQSAASAEDAARSALGDAAFDALRAEGRTPSAADRVVADAVALVDGAPAAGAG